MHPAARQARPARAALRFLVPLLAVAGPLAAFACSTGESRECRVGVDCASGVCSEDGVCASGGPVDPTGGDAALAPVSDGGPELVDATQIDAALPGCVPNNDGVITRAEVPLQAGLRATYRVATNPNEVTTTAGLALDGGATRLWDFAGTYASDQSVLVETLPLTGKWYAPKFANATYATRLSQSTDLLGVFEVTQGGVTLRGVVSPADGDKRTELSYTPAPAIVAYPLQLGAKWKTKAAIEGVAPAAQGGTAYTVSNASEEYDAEADAVGVLKTPFGTFQVIRVRTILTRTLPSFVYPFSTATKVRSYAWVTECFGTVATATSKTDEANAEFQPAELRRLAP
jgi:hypothetical protein